MRGACVSKHLNLLLLALWIAAFSSGGVHAYTLTSKEGRFTVEMPDRPKLETRQLRNRIGGDTVTSYEWYYDRKKPEATWETSYRDLNKAPMTDAALLDKFYDVVIS